MSVFRQKWLAEWQLLYSDSWLKIVLFVLPPLLFTLFWLIFSANLATDIAVGVVDLDKSNMSRQLIRYYDANPTLKIADEYDSVAEGNRALRGGDIYALIVLPRSMANDTVKGMPPQITAFVNGQILLVAKLVRSALLQSHGTFAAGVDVIKMLAGPAPEIKQAFAGAVPVRGQITALFNQNSNYAHFLVPAALPAMWQILIVVSSILAIATSCDKAGIAGWIGQTPLVSLAAKILPYTLLHMAIGAGLLIFMFCILDWPMRGSWQILLGGQLLMIFACQGVGCLLFLCFRSAAHAMSLASGYTAPAFAFMGVTFPASDMPLAAQVWRALLLVLLLPLSVCGVVLHFISRNSSTVYSEVA